MANINLTFTGAQAAITEMVDLLSQTYSYQATVISQQTGQSISNPESKSDFITRVIKAEILQRVADRKKLNTEIAALDIT